jgi:hypothetical protein
MVIGVPYGVANGILSGTASKLGGAAGAAGCCCALAAPATNTPAANAIDRAKRDSASETFHQLWMQKFQFGATPPAGGNFNAPACHLKNERP